MSEDFLNVPEAPPVLHKLNLKRGYPMCLSVHPTTNVVRMVSLEEVPVLVGHLVEWEFKTLKIERITEQRPARGGHDMPATYYELECSVVSEINAPNQKAPM